MPKGKEITSFEKEKIETYLRMNKKNGLTHGIEKSDDGTTIKVSKKICKDGFLK